MKRADSIEEKSGFDGRKSASGIRLLCTSSHFMPININFWQ
jgi:hypothetical protein